MSCFGGLAEEGVHLPDLREGRVGRPALDWLYRSLNAASAASLVSVHPSEPSRGSPCRLARTTGRTRRPSGSSAASRGAGRFRSSRIWSRGIASCGLRQILRAPDVDRAADLAFGDAQALDDQVPQVLGADRQGLEALDLGELVAPPTCLSDGDCWSCLRQVASCLACSGASSFASFSPRPRPSPPLGAGSGGRDRTGSAR